MGTGSGLSLVKNREVSDLRQLEEWQDYHGRTVGQGSGGYQRAKSSFGALERALVKRQKPYIPNAIIQTAYGAPERYIISLRSPDNPILHLKPQHLDLCGANGPRAFVWIFATMLSHIPLRFRARGEVISYMPWSSRSCGEAEVFGAKLGQTHP